MIVMLTQVSIENFKSIGKEGVSIEFKPLTIITGPNGSGKSSILEGISVLSQARRLPKEKVTFGPREKLREKYQQRAPTLENSLRWGRLFRAPNVETISYKKLLGPIKISLRLSLSADDLKQLGTEKNHPSSAGYSFLFDAKKNTVVHEFSTERPVCTIKKVEDSTHVFPEKSKKSGSLGFLMTGTPISELDFKAKGSEDILAESFLGMDPLERLPSELDSSLIVRRSGEVEKVNEDKANINQLFDYCLSIKNVLASKFDRVFLISSNRGTVEFNVPVSNRVPEWVGLNGENLLEMLSFIFSTRKYHDAETNITQWASRFGIGNLEAGWGGSDMLKSDFEDNVLKETVLELPLASFGSRQILTIIAQIFWSKPEDIIMIEEPEISLHPQSQLSLVELFAVAVKQKKQIIITTHSPIMLMALSRVVKDGLISSDKIAIYEVTKKEAGSVAKRLPINSNGQIENWVPSFKTVEDDLFKEMAKDID
jgi:predicted ATPase